MQHNLKFLILMKDIDDGFPGFNIINVGKENF